MFSGAVSLDEYERMVKEAGFSEVKITVNEYSTCCEPGSNDPHNRGHKRGGYRRRGKR